VILSQFVYQLQEVLLIVQITLFNPQVVKELNKYIEYKED